MPSKVVTTKISYLPTGLFMLSHFILFHFYICTVLDLGFSKHWVFSLYCRQYIFIEISDLKNFIQGLNYFKYPDDISLIRLGWLNFNCSVLHSFYNVRSDCSFNTSLEWLTKHNFDLSVSEASYNIYKAAYVLAHSIHEMLLQKYDLYPVENNSEQKRASLK